MISDRISVVGLGKLGLCLAACFAEKGFTTIGVDIEERVVNLVNQGITPWYEPGLADLIDKHHGEGLHATRSHQEAIEVTDITFILVATPSNPDGSFSNRFVESALRSLAIALRESKKDSHLFVISSTVMPGSTTASFIPTIEEYSGRTLNHGFSVCYTPDFVALGNVIKGFLHPDIVLIGESIKTAGDIVEAIFQKMCENQPAISRMEIINAEIAKVCLNVYITTKISFANSIANLCEQIPGANVDAVTKAIGMDRRISPYYFQGGLSYGGVCFPRDTRAYKMLAAEWGVQAELIHATEKVNQFQDRHLAELVLRELARLHNKTVAILGLAFTPHTSVVKESPALKLITELIKHDIRIIVHDPYAIDETRAVFGSSIEYAHSISTCIEQVGLIVVMLRISEFRQGIEASTFTQPTTIIDCWRILDPQNLPAVVRYVAIGKASQQPDNGTA